MQRLITEDSASPHRVEAAMTVTTYGRRMVSTLAAIAEARVRNSLAIPSSVAKDLFAQLDAMIASLEGSAEPLQLETTSGAPQPQPQPEPTIDVGTRTLQDAQIERLRAQLAVLRRAIARYQGA